MVGNSEIVTISNQYKDTLDDLIDSLDPESSDRTGPIYERSRNVLMSKGSSANLSEEDSLNEDLSDGLSQLAPKTENLQICQCRVVKS